MRADGAVLVGAIISDGARRSVRMEHCLSELRRPFGKTPTPPETHSHSPNDECNRENLLSYNTREPLSFFFLSSFESLVCFSRHVFTKLPRGVSQHIERLPL